MAWANHFEAFSHMDEDKILADYDDTSIIDVYNDACPEGKQKVMSYTGKTEIKAFFKYLFTTLGINGSNIALPEFTGRAPNPIVEPSAMDDFSLPPTSNVFLVWSAVGQGITHATETFTWKKGGMVKKQNIVVTEDGATDECVATGVIPVGAEGPITDGWTNHFDAFGSKNVTKILLDYNAASIIRIWDNTLRQFSEHKGLTAIETMFEGLFKAIKDADNGDGTADSEGIKVPVVSNTPQHNSVFLVWESFSNPKATDTFIFDDAGIIVRQNIVTNSKVATEVVTVV